MTPAVAKHLTAKRVARMHSAGVNVFVLGKKLSSSAAARVRAQAARNAMLAIAPHRAAADANAPACSAADLARSDGLCAVTAPSLVAGASLTTRAGVDLVVVHLRRAADVNRAAAAAQQGRLLVAPPFRSSRGDRTAWRAAIKVARTSETLDIGARVMPAKAAQVDAFAKLVASGKSATITVAENRRAEPSELRATGATQTSISLAWQKPPRGASSYGVYANGALRFSTTSPSAQVGSLVCGTNYTLEVDAVWKNRRSGRVGITAATSACPSTPGPTPPADTQSPTQPSNLAVASRTTTSITINWTASTDNVGVAGYSATRNGAADGASSSTSYSFAGLACGSTYTLGVSAYDAAGNRSAASTLSAATSACGADTSPPTTPGGLSQSGSTQTSATLSWSASSDNIGVTGYSVYANGVLAGTTTATSYTVSALACGTTYTLGVEARDAAGNVSGRATRNASTAACTVPDTTPPAKPTGLTMSANTDTSITLVWNPTTDNVGVAGHRLYRGGAVVGTSGPTTYTYTYTGLTCGSSYTLALEVFDAAGNQSLKEEATTVRSTLPCSGPPPPPPPPGGSLYVSPSGSDANPCSLAAPCASFDRAYHAAQPGNAVEVLAGSYGEQSMTADSSKTSGAVVFQPAAGASVTIDRLYVEGSSFVTFRNLRFSSRVTVENTSPGSNGSTDVLLENVESQTLRIVGQVRNITVRGGSFGNTTDNQPQIKKYNPSDPDSSRPYNVLIEGAYFHDFRRSGSAVHTECLQLIHSNTVTVRNSRFNNCDGTGDIGVTDGPHDNLTIENNFLGRDGDAYFSVQLTKNIRNLVFRYNSASKAVIFSDSDSGGPYSFVGNYMPHNASTCSSGVSYAYNVFEGGTCGSSDRSVTALRFVDVAGFDLHLAAGSEAIDAGDPGNYPATDLDGNGRSGAPDAGADER